MTSQEDMIGFAREALGLSESVSLKLSPLEGRGSDRTFFRLKWNRKDSAILVHYDPKRVENTCYADIAVFLREIDVPAPRLIRHDPAVCLIVMEDLGETDLWSFRKTAWETRRALYQKTLAIVHRLHSFPKDDFPSGRVSLMEGFGPDLYRWERDYFRDHFVRDVCGIKLGPSFERELEAELSALADRLAGTMRCLVHRDLQSQNVMIRDGEPFLIDFQGMRFGSPFYDLGSLLCDPYVRLSTSLEVPPEPHGEGVNFSGSEQEELLSFYYGLWSPAGGILSKVEGSRWDMDWATFQNHFWEASAQRLMQALGAYGFLGLKKGLKTFLEHTPTGLQNLQYAASHAANLPRLRQLSVTCQRTIEKIG
jgi:N-acetylmuramate 1-kinase